jgi:hypothetical protein
VHRIDRAGRFDESIGGPVGRTLRLGFGGGIATLFAKHTPRPLMPLAQTGFTLGRVVPRADGSYLAIGGVKVLQYKGEGTGWSTAAFAAAALRPDMTLDPDFGGAADALRLSVGIPRQRSASVRVLKRVLIRIRSSAPGLAIVKVRARGRVIAQMTVPLYTAGTSSMRVRLTKTGERMLRRGTGVPVAVNVRARDFLAVDATARASGRLRN